MDGAYPFHLCRCDGPDGSSAEATDVPSAIAARATIPREFVSLICGRSRAGECGPLASRAAAGFRHERIFGGVAADLQVLAVRVGRTGVVETLANAALVV